MRAIALLVVLAVVWTASAHPRLSLSAVTRVVGDKKQVQDQPCGPDGAYCYDYDTCCPGSLCCPITNAVCCSDKHCCPAGSICDPPFCLSTSDTVAVTRLIAKRPDTNSSLSVICPDQSPCPNESTCCPISGGYGCCLQVGATCCSDGIHCCPGNTQCDQESGTCVIPETVKATPMRPLLKTKKRGL